MRVLHIIPFLLLAACEPEPENIQAKADSMTRQLEERANQISAEAANDMEAQSAPLENEAEALLNRIAGGEPGNAASNSANSQ